MSEIELLERCGEQDVISMMGGCDVILTEPLIFKISIQEHYSQSHYIDDLRLAKEVLEELHPQYIPAFERVMQGNKISTFNMFITKEKILNDYCQWLFPMLFELERRVDISNRSKHQSRVFGFVAERLLNVYFTHNDHLRVSYLPICFLRSGRVKKYMRRQTLFTRVKYNIIFLFRRLTSSR